MDVLKNHVRPTPGPCGLPVQGTTNGKFEKQEKRKEISEKKTLPKSKNTWDELVNLYTVECSNSAFEDSGNKRQNGDELEVLELEYQEKLNEYLC